MEHNSFSCFLGANSRYGFRSLYSGFCSPEKGCWLNIIKGGPGCGKSSFMKRIASAAEGHGLAAERVFCSGDPDSLDGVFIPALAVGYVDGTAPHSMDCPYPAACGSYIDLGRFYDTDALHGKKDTIMELNTRYKALYADAYRQISAGAAMLPKYETGLWGNSEKDTLRKKLDAFIKRDLVKGAAEGGKILGECFLGALSCKGQVFLEGSLKGYEKLCMLDNSLGMGHYFLDSLLGGALKAGHDLIVCRDFLDPELISGLLIPGASLAVFCSDSGIDSGRELYRRLRLDNLVPRASLAAFRPALRRSARLGRDCLSFASETLAEAKALHDELEAVYNPHVDFDGVYSEAERHIARLF